MIICDPCAGLLETARRIDDARRHLLDPGGRERSSVRQPFVRQPGPEKGL